jgi:hypothetical protein
MLFMQHSPDKMLIHQRAMPITFLLGLVPAIDACPASERLARCSAILATPMHIFLCSRQWNRT